MKVCRGQSCAGGCEAVRIAQNSPNPGETVSAATRKRILQVCSKPRAFGGFGVLRALCFHTDAWCVHVHQQALGAKTVERPAWQQMNPILQRRFGALEAVLLFRHVAVLSMHTTHSNCSKAYTHDHPHLFSSVGLSAFRQSRGCVCVDARYSAAALHTGSGEKSQLPRTLDGIGADCSVWHSWQ